MKDSEPEEEKILDDFFIPSERDTEEIAILTNLFKLDDDFVVDKKYLLPFEEGHVINKKYV